MEELINGRYATRYKARVINFLENIRAELAELGAIMKKGQLKQIHNSIQGFPEMERTTLFWEDFKRIFKYMHDHHQIVKEQRENLSANPLLRTP